MGNRGKENIEKRNRIGRFESLLKLTVLEIVIKKTRTTKINGKQFLSLFTNNRL